MWHWDKTNKGNYHFKWCELFVPREWLAGKSFLIVDYGRTYLQGFSQKVLLHIPKMAFILFWLTRDNRDLKQMAAATATTATGNRMAQKWRSAHAWKLPSGLPSNPTTWGSVLWRTLHYYVSPFFIFFPTVTGFKPYHILFFTLSKKHLTSSLGFTNSESKWGRKPVATVWVPLV